MQPLQEKYSPKLKMPRIPDKQAMHRFADKPACRVAGPDFAYIHKSLQAPWQVIIFAQVSIWKMGCEQTRMLICKNLQNQKSLMDTTQGSTFIHPGARHVLPRILENERAGKILLFTGKNSWCGIRDEIESLLHGRKYTRYCDFTVNPKEEEIIQAQNELKNEAFDLVIAVGGGSVIDFAKVFRHRLQKQIKLVAIPTTFGTGAEATQFAVLYVNGKKTSVDDTGIKPDYAIVDSALGIGQPAYLKACTALDALAQSVESFWSVRSTEQSRGFASTGIGLIREHIVRYARSEDPLATEAMAKAAHMAGRAINISRTTAAHAFSYEISSRYNIPHGHAVALTLPSLWKYNAVANEDAVTDRRGFEYLKNVFADLGNLLASDPIEYFHSLYRQLGLEYDLKRLGMDSLDFLREGVNEQRLVNNPVRINIPEFLAQCQIDVLQ